MGAITHSGRRRSVAVSAVVFALIVAVVSACASSSARQCGSAVDSGELSRLATTTDSTAAALRRATDSASVALRQYLQSVVDRAAALDACGRVTSPRDLRTAAQIGLSAGQLGAETLERAYRWSRRAVVADTSDRASWRLMAGAWDQLQLVQRQPQWFGTVLRCGGPATARCALAPIDTTRVTEAQRVELGLRTLLQQREHVDSLNRSRGRP
jgi:hypothetical protein